MVNNIMKNILNDGMQIAFKEERKRKRRETDSEVSTLERTKTLPIETRIQQS